MAMPKAVITHCHKPDSKCYIIQLRYRNALTKIRSISHHIEIVLDRNTKPKLHKIMDLGLNIKQNGKHFVMKWTL